MRAIKALTYKKRLLKSLPELNQIQNDILDLISERWETMTHLQKELDDYAKANGTLTIPGTNGVLKIHPAATMYRQALSDWVLTVKLLRDTFDSQEEKKEVSESFNGMMTKAKDLLAS